MTHRNAELQLRAYTVADVTPLTPAKRKLAHDYSLQARRSAALGNIG
jgi:hypothetical protein